jgi:hypothetical protein
VGKRIRQRVVKATQDTRPIRAGQAAPRAEAMENLKLMRRVRRLVTRLPGQIGRRQWPIVQQKPRGQMTMGETMTGAYKGDCQTGHMDPSVIKSEPLQS